MGKGTRQASHLRTGKDLLWDTEKKNNFSQCHRGKGILPGKWKRH